MQQRKIIFSTALILAFLLSFVLNKQSLAGVFEETGPPAGGSGEDCKSTEHTYLSYSTLDGPPQSMECSNCVLTGEIEEVYIDGQKVGILYKRSLIPAPQTVTNCKFFNSPASSCTEISFLGSNNSCADIFSPDTDSTAP